MDDGIKELSYKKGAAVVVENSDNPGFLYVVREGVLKVDTERRKGDKALSRFEKGDSFGLVSALTGHKFLVTIYADTDSVVLRVPIKLIGSFLHKNRELALKMISVYSGELRALQKHLSRANKPEDRENHPRNLIKIGDFYSNSGNARFASYAYNTFIEWQKSKEEHESNDIRIASEKLAATGIQYSGPYWDSHTLTIPAGEILFLEHEFSDHIYLVLKGSVILSKIVRDREFIIDVLDDGEIFGEMAFIESTSRMANAITHTDSVIMRIPPRLLFDRVGEAILQKIVQSLARRIWFAHQRLSILKVPDALYRVYFLLESMIMDDMIKKGKRPIDHLTDQFYFTMTFDELMIMCGILNIKSETEKHLRADSNLVFENNRISVLNRKRLEDKVTAGIRTNRTSYSMM